MVKEFYLVKNYTTRNLEVARALADAYAEADNQDIEVLRFCRSRSKGKKKSYIDKRIKLAYLAKSR